MVPESTSGFPAPEFLLIKDVIAHTPLAQHHALLAFLIHVNSLIYFEKPSVRPKWPVEQQPWGINAASGGIRCPVKIATLYDEIVFFVI